MRIAYIITGLETGGAEVMLYNLLGKLDLQMFQPEVVSLMDTGAMGKKIQALNIPVHALGMSRGVPSPSALIRLAKWLRSFRPGVVHTWMYHADLLGGIGAKLAGGFPVVWGIHNSTLVRKKSKATTIWTTKMCARLSPFLAHRIVCCSEVARQLHVNLGYASGRMTVIPNGFDLEVFKPDLEARAAVRRELGLCADTPLVGRFGRFDPQKDHETFFQAAFLLNERLPDCHFVLCGGGVTWDNRDLVQWIEKAGLSGRTHLLGLREDIPRITAALDVATSSSLYGEAFPCVIGEAMASGVPCVVTDVGDSGLMVGDTGRVVAPKDAQGLAGGVHEILQMDSIGRLQLGEAARQRVRAQFDLTVIAKRYEEVYQAMVGSASGGGHDRFSRNKYQTGQLTHN